MPFGLIALGVLLLVVGYQDTYKEFAALLKNDFTGKGNFFYWLVAIVVIGLIGHVKGLENFSGAFMVLIIVAMIVGNKGLFANAEKALAQTATAN